MSNMCLKYKHILSNTTLLQIVNKRNKQLNSFLKTTYDTKYIFKYNAK